MHRLLKRQLRKAGLDPDTLDGIQSFLDQVDEAYHAFDNDLYHVENILEKSSQELFNANLQLKSHVEDVTTKLSRVANNINEVIFEIDLKGNWSYLNRAWESLSGFLIEDSLGMPYQNFLIDPDGKPMSDLIDFEDYRWQARNRKFQIRTVDGQLKWLDFSVQSTNQEDGQCSGYIGTIVDITRLKEIESDLVAAREEAMAVSRAKDEFLSTMSHEIRTPLNAVVGISHLLLMENPKKAQIENLNALKFSSEHLLELVSDILDFNKISLGCVEFEDVNFDLQTMLDGLQSIFVNKTSEKGIGFAVHKDARLPRVVKGDHTRLKQVLVNLINNAIKFTERGQVVLEVGVEREEEDSFTLGFSVVDTGIGIAEDKLEKIFESFSQANSDTTRLYGGTGLGLSISKKLLEGMNSTLKVRSTLGKGSVFSFSIGLNKSDLEDQEFNCLIDYDSLEAVRDDLHGVKVLVAEDNTLNVLVIKKFMANWNIDFDLAYDGEMAVEKAENNCYGLILLDLHMPKMDGYDAALAIRSSNNPFNRVVPIYALTASAGSDITHKIGEFGMNGVINKPFDPDELYRTLKQIVAKSRLMELGNS